MFSPSRPRSFVGKTTESVHPQNFQYGLVIWHTKKGRKNFWGLACGKRGIVLFGVKSIECCKKRLNDVIVFCASFTVHNNLLCNPPRLPATTLTQTYITRYTTQHSKRRTTATHLYEDSYMAQSTSNNSDFALGLYHANLYISLALRTCLY